MTNHWDDDSWQASADDEFDEDASEGEEHSDEWDEDDYEDFLAREFPDSTARTNWAGGRPLWHITVWVVLAAFVGGFLLLLF
ncbi:hypothetical protein [Rhodopirellula sp. P2]|uniref:hypothetical protein n=1 Tax=Rhodopirellula sp. P2 TaxID=2127060 RepID=UPI002368797E|nr:hypothetical protein [Rhodopirellula sp. P2]WDQ15340.1 hypothetical protein PSR62_17040 [Rhodopirellula sp. P2]